MFKPLSKITTRKLINYSKSTSKLPVVDHAKILKLQQIHKKENKIDHETIQESLQRYLNDMIKLKKNLLTFRKEYTKTPILNCVLKEIRLPNLIMRKLLKTRHSSSNIILKNPMDNLIRSPIIISSHRHSKRMNSTKPQGTITNNLS